MGPQTWNWKTRLSKTVDMPTVFGIFNHSMKIDTSTKKLLADPADNYAKRRAWVIYQLKLKGESLASVARKAGYNRHVPQLALRTTYPKVEVVIAKALGMEPKDLFPERYDQATGLPYHRFGRPKKSNTKDTTKRRARNVKTVRGRRYMEAA